MKRKSKKTDAETAAVKKSAAIVERIKPLLAEQGPEMQGYVLADLTGMWLAGHVIPDSKEETDALRDRVLEMHIAMVRMLTFLNAKQLGT